MNPPVTCWCNKVQTAVNSTVRDSRLSVDASFFFQIFVVLFIYVLQNWVPAVATLYKNT